MACVPPFRIWVTSEDHGPEMGCYGDKLARTPNIDALAAKGMMFKKGSRVWLGHLPRDFSRVISRSASEIRWRRCETKKPTRSSVGF